MWLKNVLQSPKPLIVRRSARMTAYRKPAAVVVSYFAPSASFSPLQQEGTQQQPNMMTK